MMKYLSSVGLVLLGGVFALAQNMPQHNQPQYPPANPQTQQQQPTSRTSTANTSDLKNEIQTALQKDPTLSGANVNVAVTDKNVELTGTVPSKDAKDTAEQIAKAHAGGLPVKNHLKVSQGGSAPK